MATFSVDKEYIHFSATRVGSTDITITNLPAAGVSASISGDTDYFAYESISSNVIRVSDTKEVTTPTQTVFQAVVRIQNNADSTDYVKVTLSQIYHKNGDSYYVDLGDSFLFPSNSTEYVYCGPDIGTDTLVVAVNETTSPSFQPLVDWLSCTFIGYADGSQYIARRPSSSLPHYYLVGHALYRIGVAANTSGSTRAGDVLFDNVTKKQITQYTYFSTTPQSLQFGDGGGDPQTVRLLDTPTRTPEDVSIQISEDWISATPNSTGQIWTVDVSTNVTSSERTGTITFTDSLGTTSVSVWQDSSSPIADITVTPRTLSFSAEGGSGTLTVTYTDTLTTNISSFPSWLSMTETSSSEGEKTFSVTASQHDSTEGRSFVIEFSNGIHTVTATVNQGGHTSSFSVTPESFTFGKEGGTSTITLINPPSNAINWRFTYDDGSGWADLIFSTPTRGTITVTNNIGTRRTASLKIWNWDVPEDYIIIPITQYGEGFYAIWNDLPVSPSSFTQGEDYHYRISSGNTVLFEGITVPIDSGSLPVPVNIPRIVESYIHSGNPEDIVPDLVLHRLEGDLTVSLYDLEDPSSPVSEGSYSFWNDWSGVNEVYDRTVTLNDPINGRGCPGMIIPFCICSDDGSSFSVDEGRPTGTVTHTLGVPQDHFSYAAAVFAAAGDVSLKDGDGNILTSYDMTHCGQGYLLYRNRYGGWDSFLIEGNIYSYDGYERLDAVYPQSKRKVTDRITIRTRYEIHTGWMNDEESGRLVYHLLSSPTVGLEIFGSPSGMIPVTVTVTQSEYKKFRNGRKMVSYTITLEENKDKTVQR